MKFISASILLLLCAIVVAGENATGGPWVELRGQRFYVEVVDDREGRSRGLMDREALAADRGMVFSFSRERVRKFWMKNTAIPLDIIFLDNQLRIVNIAKDAQPCKKAPCVRYSSQQPVRHVIEVNAGVASSLGLAPGDTVRFSWHVGVD